MVCLYNTKKSNRIYQLKAGVSLEAFDMPGLVVALDQVLNDWNTLEVFRSIAAA